MNDPLLSRLDAAIESTKILVLDTGDLLALAAWWLVERVGRELGLCPWEAAAQVAMMASEAARHMDQVGRRDEFH